MIQHSVDKQQHHEGIQYGQPTSGDASNGTMNNMIQFKAI